MIVKYVFLFGHEIVRDMRKSGHNLKEWHQEKLVNP